MIRPSASEWPAQAVERLQDAFAPARDPARAGPMAAYMKDQFPFLGIPTPARRALQRTALAPLARPAPEALVDTASTLWTLPEREYQYAACDVLARHAQVLTRAAVSELERLLTRKAWWDTVDALRVPVSTLVAAHRDLEQVLRGWNASDDRWLVRSSIIVQLGWKQRTDAALLFELCAARATDPDFFVRKGIGWALREYSKVAPDAVRAFVSEHPELSTLSKREALKWVDR